MPRWFQPVRHYRCASGHPPGKVPGRRGLPLILNCPHLGDGEPGCHPSRPLSRRRLGRALMPMPGYHQQPAHAEGAGQPASGNSVLGGLFLYWPQPPYLLGRW